MNRLSHSGWKPDSVFLENTLRQFLCLDTTRGTKWKYLSRKAHFEAQRIIPINLKEHSIILSNPDLKLKLYLFFSHFASSFFYFMDMIINDLSFLCFACFSSGEWGLFSWNLEDNALKQTKEHILNGLII